MKGVFMKLCRTFGTHGTTTSKTIPRILFEDARQKGMGESPCIVVSGMEGWPARRWDLEYLREHFGHMVVPVEISQGKGDYRSIFDADFEAKRGKFEAGCLMTLDEYSEWFLQCRDAPKADVRGYIAQCRLNDYLPGLLDGIQTPTIREVTEGLHQINFWLGPEGTETPLHRDPYFNLLCQVFGEKYVRLYDTEQSTAMYPFQNGLLRNTSQVDVENPDKQLHPKFELAPYWESILGPGEMLYVPQRWWHYVQSRTVSFSVNFWWNKSA